MGADRRRLIEGSSPARRHVNGMGLFEVCVIIAVIVILVVLLLPAITRARAESRKASCRENMNMIGKALYAYSANSNEFYPFCWGPADKEQVRRKDAMTSIGLLYPCYLADASVFKCPKTKDSPWFRTNAPFPVKDRNGDGVVDHDDVLKSEAYVWSNRNDTLMDSSYGYDCRVYPAAVSNHAIVADMDGSQGASPDKHTSNHRDGHNVLYVDGSVRWLHTNYCSNDPNDNIFTEDAWHADTDSFISDNTPPGSDDTPGAFNDLSVSHDAFRDLKPR